MMQTARRRRVGLLVCHGMGQQVCYETLDSVARAIVAEHTRLGLRSSFRPRGIPRSASPGAMPLARAELVLEDEHGLAHEVHLYEAYWAPLTEGEISLRESIVFLLNAGWTGLKYCAREGPDFLRWTFGKEVRYPIKHHTPIAVAAALVGVLLLYLNLCSIVISLPAALFYHFGTWATDMGHGYTSVRFAQALALSLNWLIGCVWAAAIPSVIAIAAFTLFGASLLLAPLRRVAYTAIRTLNSYTVAGLNALLLVYLVSQPGAPKSFAASWFAAVAITDFINGHAWLMMIVLPVGFWLLRRVNFFLVQYVGDVGIYVSASSVNRFWKIREEIKRVCLSVAKEIFECRAPDGSREYEEIVIMGHSLGSAIAYHTLNAIFEEDDLNGGRLNAIGRATHLITYGSPLDKIAFLFRSQAQGTPYRNALDAALEPLIFDYRFRNSLKWTNILAKFDFISGELSCYDDLGWRETQDPRRVHNLIDPDGPLNPAHAHTGYTERPLLRRVLHDAVM